MSDTEDFRYTNLVGPDGEDDHVAGIMDASGMLPEGVPSVWKVCFGVDDTDATLATAVDLGGEITFPAEETPYGRLAEAADPVGARFSLVAPNEAMPAK
jgi:hypothetical protein